MAIKKPSRSADFAPLRGVTVLEVSGRVAGSYCGLLLSQLGAEVIRVDIPRTAYVIKRVERAYFQLLDRGKRTIAGDELSETLTAGVTIAVYDSLRAGVADDEARVRSLMLKDAVAAPCVEISDFGSIGERCNWTGSNIATAAWAAMTWATGSPDQTPLSLPGDLAEYIAGAHAAALVVASLLHHDPDHDLVDSEVAVADVLGYITAMIVNNFIPYGRPWHRDGPKAVQSGGCYPGAIFEALDGPIMVMCRQQAEWDGLVDAMGRPEWTRAPKFRDPRDVARESSEEADRHLKPWIASLTKAEIVELGRKFGFPVGPVRQVGEALADPQFAYRGFFEAIPVDECGTLQVPSTPWLAHVEQITDTAASACEPQYVAGKPLSGVRVLDLSWVWSGPMVTSILADLGADVVKVEHPSKPDPARSRGPARVEGVPIVGPPLDLSPYFNQLGHGKRSIGIDMRAAPGRDLILELVKTSDVVVENMRPGALARCGLDIDALRSVNPNIVLLSMTTVGQDGPSSAMMGYGMVMSGLAGLESLVGYDHETMGMFNLAISDPIAGSHAVVALLAALYRQRRTGESTWIDLSQTECTLAVLLEQIIESQLCGRVEVPQNRHTHISPHGIYAARGDDAWVALAVPSARSHEAMASEISSDPLGIAGEDALDAQLRRWVAERSVEQVCAAARSWGASAAPVMSFEALNSSAWYYERGFGNDVDHPYLGTMMLAAVPWMINGAFPQVQAASPLLGEHTQQVLQERLGCSPREIAELCAAGVVMVPEESPVRIDELAGVTGKDCT